MCAGPDTVAHSKCHRGGLHSQHESGSLIKLWQTNEPKCRYALAHPRGHFKCFSCARLTKHSIIYNFFNRREIHELELSTENIQSFSRSGIIDFVQKCRTLVTFSFSVSSRAAVPLEDCVQFAQAVGASNLRDFTFYGMRAADACAFFENLPASQIYSLVVSLDEMNPAEEAAVLASVVRFITDPVRSRSVRHLYLLSFSQDARCFLEHVILGSRDALAPDAPEADAQAPNLSIIYLLCGASSDTNDAIEFPAWMAQSRYRVTDRSDYAALGVTDCSEYAALEAICARNRSICELTRLEACTLMCAARIVGCRVRFLGDCPGIFPFVLLPEEIRMRILTELAPHLDRTQFISVCSWACCAATIGYCCRPRPDPRPPMEPVLPVPPWNWETCTTCPAHAAFFVHENKAFDDEAEYAISRRSALPLLVSTGTNCPPLHI